MEEMFSTWGEAAMTAVGFFWKAGWAFVLGYAVSGMIQAFVPKARLTRQMGDPGLMSVSLATVFGAASSSCSFAALAAADDIAGDARRDGWNPDDSAERWCGRRVGAVANERSSK